MVSNSGNGIYRSVIVAIAGLVLIGAGEPPKKAGYSDQTDAAKPEQHSAPTVPLNASETIPKVKSEKQQEPCGNSRYDSNDDLCAQWKAADAASDAAQWARWQLWLSGFGIVGLLISLWFTRCSINLANDTHKAFIRAEDASLLVNFPSGNKIEDGSFLLNMTIANTGRSAMTIHKMEICGTSIIMEKVILAGEQTGLPDFATVPADRKLIMKVIYSTPFHKRQVEELEYVVLPPKGKYTTWWAINIDWNAQKA